MSQSASSAAPTRAVPKPGPFTAPLLAGVAGFVDTTGFIVLAGIFMAHVTGNFVVLGASLAGQGHGSIALKLSVLPLFVVGVVIGWVVLRWHVRPDAHPARGPRRLATLQGLTLLACSGVGLLIQRGSDPIELLRPVAMSLGVLAMGMQSMLARSLQLPMTHVMTGNVTQLTVEVLDARVAGVAAPGVRRSLLVVGMFAVGAAVAGLVAPSFGLAGMAIPGLTLLLIAGMLTQRPST